MERKIGDRMINSAKIPKAYSEVYSLINALGDSYINKKYLVLFIIQLK